MPGRSRRGRRSGTMRDMTVTTLESLGTYLLDAAKNSSNGRSSRTVHSGVRLRQTLIALQAGTRMQMHQSEGDATVLCLRGQVTLHWGDRNVTVPAGALTDVPTRRHDLVADEDSVALLTVALG